MIRYQVDDFQFRRDAGVFMIRGWAFMESGDLPELAVRADGIQLTGLIVQAEPRPDVSLAFPMRRVAQPVGFRIRGELTNGRMLVLELADPAGGDRVAERLSAHGARQYLALFRRLWHDLRRTDTERLSRIVAQTRTAGPMFIFGKIWSKIHQRPTLPLSWYPTPVELERERNDAWGDDAPLVSVVVPLYNTPLPLLTEMLGSVQAQTYRNWELCLADGSDEAHAEVGETVRRYAAADSRIRYRKLEGNGGITANSNAALEMSRGSFVALLDHDDLLTPHALYENVRAMKQHPEADFFYSDECNFDKSILEPFQFHFKRDFSFENLRSNNFICHLSVFRRTLYEAAGGFRPGFDGSQDHDLIFRLCEKAREIVHIRKVLYGWRLNPASASNHTSSRQRCIDSGVRAVQSHLDRVGLAGKAEQIPPHSIYRVRYTLNGTPKISILVADSGSGEQLAASLRSIQAKTTWQNREVLVSGCRPELPSAAADAVSGVRYFAAEPPINRASLYMRMLREAAGDYVVLLDSRAEVLTPDWLEELLMFAQRSDVGAVGAKVLFPDGSIRDAGIVLGKDKIVGTMHYRASKGFPGHIGRLLYAQEFQAVSFDCAMLERRFFAETLGGMDRSFSKISDIECCLRAKEAGRKVIWTPFAQLRFTGGEPARPEKEVKRLIALHPAFFRGADPSYNPNLSQSAANFEAEPVSSGWGSDEYDPS